MNPCPKAARLRVHEPWRSGGNDERAFQLVVSVEGKKTSYCTVTDNVIGVGGIGLRGELRGAGAGEGVGELALREGQNLVATAWGLGVNRTDRGATNEHDQK